MVDENAYSVDREIQSLNFNIEVEEAKIKDTMKMLNYYRQKRSFLMRAKLLGVKE